jgi:alkanesulfonate monooxygenase SsuD/methylene tetrahydromethanopterin reductase-like flavin-dependent oxidoreductase (luciferase family)
MQVFGNTIRFGVQVGPSRPFPELLETWLRLEQLGFDIAYITDHFVSYSPATGVAPVLEGPTALSALAAKTTTMRCGTMVAGNTFRNPAILAKVAVTLDHVSGGRFELGMGSGHIQFEHEQYNIPYYTRGRRLRMLGEAAKIVRSLLTEERTSFNGRYYELSEAFCEPKPLQDPLPILIGGIGEDLTMRVVAESADIWNNWTSPDLETYTLKLNALGQHCNDVGPKPTILRTCLVCGDEFHLRAGAYPRKTCGRSECIRSLMAEKAKAQPKRFRHRPCVVCGKPVGPRALLCQSPLASRALVRAATNTGPEEDADCLACMALPERDCRRFSPKYALYSAAQVWWRKRWEPRLSKARPQMWQSASPFSS